MAVAINQVIVFAYNFSLNKYWSFQSKEFAHRQLARYLCLFAFNYGFSVAVMYVFNARLGADYRLVRVASIAVVMTWNFLLYRHWVYQEPPLSKQP